jgi:PIN domain nuclease of toxin-antitoxin system
MIVLDTHAWIWCVNQEPAGALSPKLIEWLETSEEPLTVSVISCLEVALLMKKKRLSLFCPLNEWFYQALQASGVTCLPLTPEIVYRSTLLPDIRFDPFDRLIIATAQVNAATLVSKDANIQLYPDVTVVWLT